MLSAWKLVPLLVLLGGCYGGVESENNPIPESERPWPVEEVSETRPLRSGQHCPVQDDSVQVAYEALPDGAALVFRTSGDVEGLQQRVRALAEAYEQGPLHGTTYQPPPDPGGPPPPGSMPAADARVEELPDGARVLVTGASPEAVRQVRDRLQIHQERFQRGACVSVSAITS